MSLSIITINLNDKTGLEKTLRSISSQSFQAFEYLVIDGGSTDGSREIMENYAGRIDKGVCEEDRGIYHAMNKGIRLSSGDYLYFMNSGDVFAADNTLEMMAPYLEKGTPIIYGDLYRGKSGIPTRYPDELSFGFLLEHVISHQAMFLKRIVFEKTSGFDESYTIIADWVVFVRAVVSFGFEYRHVNEIICRFDDQGISSQKHIWPLIIEQRARFFGSEFPMFYKDMAELVGYRRSKRIQYLSGIENSRLLRGLLTPILYVLFKIAGSQKK